VASGFAAAGAGAVAFYALARPAISNLTQDYTKLQSAQSAYQFAQQKAAVAPTAANLKAEKAALVNLQAVRRGMTADEGSAAAGISRLSAEYHKLTAAFAPEAFKVFNAGLRVANNLLPTITPFANTFANVLSKLLQQAAKFTASKGFADWLKQFHSLEGPALNSIGQGIGKVTVAIGKLMTTMSGKDVAHALNIAFGTLATTINVVAGAIHRFMQNWDGMSSAAAKAGKAIAQTASDITSSVEAMVGHVVSAWNRMVSGIQTAASAVVRVAASIPGRILGALGNLGSLLFDAGRAVIDGLIHGIESAMGGLLHVVSSIAGFIAAHKGPLDYDRTLLVPHGEAIMQGLMDGMQSRMPDLMRELGGISGAISGTRFPSARMGAGGTGAGAGNIQLEILPAGASAFEQFMVLALRKWVRLRGGNVQTALGH